MSPVVVVSPAYRVELIRMLILYDLLSDSFRVLKPIEIRPLGLFLPIAKTNWVVKGPYFSCKFARTPLSFCLWLIFIIIRFNNVSYEKRKIISIANICISSL